MRVLVIEDSERLQRSLEVGLGRSGFSVDVASDGEQGLEYALAAEYEVLVLDLMLPKMSGLEVLERLRNREYDAHILILSARDQIADRVRGLEMGADDYLVKPFSFDELTARLRALTRRRHDEKCPVLKIGGVELDTSRRAAMRDGQRICLTPKEYGLFEFLALRRGQVFSKDRLIEQLYPYDTDVSENMIEVLISGLRKKLHSPDEPSLIETRRGFGYLIDKS